jgi:hypothetical protein
MDKLLRWLSKGVQSLVQAPLPADDEAYTSYERVDGSLLPAHGFRASDSMRFDDLARLDFSDTMPAFTPARRVRPAAEHHHYAA